MNNCSFKEYLDIFGKQILMVCVGVICLSIVFWNLFPTYYSCCDASDYWKISDDFSLMKNTYLGMRGFFYPLLIAVTRLVPNSLQLNLNLQHISLSIVQLSLHIISTIALGYITYFLSKNKFITLCTLLIYGLDIFLIVFTNEILTDGVAVDFLVITTALLVGIVNRPDNKLLIIGFSFLAGLLPMIRPSLILISITLYLIFIYLYIYKYNLRFLRSSVLLLGISFSFFLSPWAIQLIFSPLTFVLLSNLGKVHVVFGSYLYKYVTLLSPTPHGYAAVNEPMKQLVSVCNGLQEQINCINQLLISHPILTFKHFITKLFAINDQVYLVGYINDFYNPFRYLWRGINCILLTSSLMGFMILIVKFVRNTERNISQAILLMLIVASCLLPLISSVPEERFGLTFHPLFVIFTSYFLDTYIQNKNSYSKRWKMIGFAIIFPLLLHFSFSIESTFSLSPNR
ncbi:hypothetical protein [Nostoc sp.]|uniref:hypothetical protein n=1 Tax=Nostoc sp. TaxID=1180 RepID=UPI002FF53C77